MWKEASDISSKDKVIGTSLQNRNNLSLKSKKLFNNSLKYLKIKKKSLVNGVKKVFDLTVPKNNSFIANGIISHNSGKSYTMGVIAESIYDLPQEIKNNLAVVMLDTMGIYWTMRRSFWMSGIWKQSL